MKYFEKFPHARIGDEVEPNIRKLLLTPVPCGICGISTVFVNYELAAFLCSEECAVICNIVHQNFKGGEAMLPDIIQLTHHIQIKPLSAEKGKKGHVLAPGLQITLKSDGSYKEEYLTCADLKGLQSVLDSLFRNYEELLLAEQQGELPFEEQNTASPEALGVSFPEDLKKNEETHCIESLEIPLPEGMKISLPEPNPVKFKEEEEDELPF